ncbi:acyl-CoA dehydrogenase family protein [Pseudonocardia sp. DSM 110487]|uniref:acyl-CoA dehydrogenase family protein n=1 Tax=Pseudonocardia sp. DSM 110487 TaxID=2865833 RepID=UPI001C6A4082|nr:acyl-CoA dehydrogenase [Pseudonocardia sp. DSM 110487]QYN35553.1 acyl-CoA dehydrogenase family protein [Pseudonocardia sp. DSM 110487]
MTVDRHALQGVLDGRWARVRDEIRAQMDELAFNPDPNLSTEEYRALTTENLRHLASTGRPRQGFDPVYGGEGDVGGVVTAFAMLGYGDLSLLVKAGVQWGLFGGAVQVLGTSRHHDEYLRQIMDGELLGCFAMTETGHGSDVQHLRTTATYDPATQEFEIHTPDVDARKDYIGNAARDGRMAVVFAQLITQGQPQGVHALLVPIRDESGAPMPGVTIGDCGRKAGLNGVDNGRLMFDHVRVPREALLNRFGDVAEDGTYNSSIANETRRFFTMLGTLVRGRISVAGGAGTATQKALALAIRYGAVRRQFADPSTGEEVVVLDYLVHQRKLLPALATTYALNFAQSDLVSDMHDLQAPGAEGDEWRQRDLETRAAGIKAVATWHATATIQTCREACGGAGYLAANLLPTLKADTDVFTTFEGDNTVLLQLVAKTLLSDYGRRVARLDMAGKARFAADLVAGSVAERTGLRAILRRGDIRDRAYQRWLLVEREQHLLTNAAQRMRKALAPGADQFGIFNGAQDHLLVAARAHVDRILFDSFAAAVDRTGDAGVRNLLGDVLRLYALTVIENDRAFFIEHSYLTSGRAKAVTQAVNALCGRLRPHARTLVDSFGIPERWLDCPLLDGERETGPAAPAPSRDEPSDLASVG